MIFAKLLPPKLQIHKALSDLCKYENSKLQIINLNDYHLPQIFAKLFPSILRIMRHHLIFANMKITNYKLSDHLIPHAPDFCEIIVFKITNDKANVKITNYKSMVHVSMMPVYMLHVSIM